MPPHEINQAIAELLGWKWFIPDYYNDLNACRGMISALKPDQRDEFAKHLTGFWDESFCGAGTLEWLFAATQFTAPQLCEAFLRTVGRWREENL